MEDKELRNLLSRTTLNMTFNEFLQQLEAIYPQVSKVERFEPILEGYEDANIKLFASTGIYVVKIFLKERTLQNVLDYIKVLEEARDKGIPVVPLIKGSEGNLSFIEEGGIRTPFFVSKFFEGENLQNTTPALDDIKAVAFYLAKLNTLDFPISVTYDSWGNRNLYQEYKKNKKELKAEQNALIEPVVTELGRIEYQQIRKGIIHGDIQRKHILKDKEGKYCILDFGSMGNAPIVYDISTFLAWFCLGKHTWSKRQEIIKIVLDEYAKFHKLSKEEIESLPTLVKASYASYYLKTSVLIKNGDTSQETKNWQSEAKDMLKLTESWLLLSD